MVASKRARSLATGGQEARVQEDSDKPTVIALRELADGLITRDEIMNPPKPEEEMVLDLNMNMDMDAPETPPQL
jgi:DNA-directed RNA polymerase subunit omega